MSHHTITFYERGLNKAIGIELTPVGINEFLNGLCCGNGKHAYYVSVRALCNWLHKEGYLEQNPIARVDSPRKTKKLLPAVTGEQVEILLGAVESVRDKCIISLLFDSGLRLNELCSIKDRDIDWQTKTVRVVVKGGREARAPFTERSATLLKQCVNGQDSVFQIKPDGVQTMLSRLSAKVGLPCNAHSFRRGFACHLHKKGLSTLSIMHLGRWSTLSMVERYTRSLSFDDCLPQYQRVNST